MNSDEVPGEDVLAAMMWDDVTDMLVKRDVSQRRLIELEEKWLHAGASPHACKLARLFASSASAYQAGQGDAVGRLAREFAIAFTQLQAEPGAARAAVTAKAPSAALAPPTSHALIMKGGGIKGLAYVGAIERLTDHYTFDWYVGTSAGAVAAVLLGAGYTADELRQILRDKDFRDFFDASGLGKWANLAIHHGLHPANTFTEWLDRLLAEKLRKPSRVKLSDLPHRVTVYASQRNRQSLKFDSVDHDADAAYAVRCSMSIPFVFIPQSDQGLRAYDGGLQHNYPINDLLSTHPGTPFISLYLGSEVYEPVRQRWVISDLISIWTESSDPDALNRYRDRTVIIDPRPIGTLDFSLTDTEKEFLLACGRAGAVMHLSGEGEECSEARRIRDELKSRVEMGRRATRRRRLMMMYLLLLAILVLSSILTWFFLLKPADPIRRQVVFDSLIEKETLYRTDFDSRMPGILVHRRNVLIDLSNEVQVAPADRDRNKTSPSVQIYDINAERKSDNAKFLVYEFASQRKFLDVICVSNHPHAVLYRQDSLPLGRGFNNVWTLVVDVSQHSRDIPFTVKFRVIRYNAYQAENKNFVGHLVMANEEEIKAKVYLPRGYLLAGKPKLLQKKQGDPAAPWKTFTGDAVVMINDDCAAFDWTLRHPSPGYSYAAEIDWVK